MNRDVDNVPAKIRKLQNLYNIIPNLIWSVLNLVPISVFCYQSIALKLIYIFLAISFLPAFFSNYILDRIQLSKTTRVYKKLGVHLINKFTQNGDIINNLIRKKFPDFKVVKVNRLSVKKLLQQTYRFEKFHLILFVFFSLVTVFALSKEYFVWAIIILLTNVVYNIYPNLLQQYIRVKLIIYDKRSQ